MRAGHGLGVAIAAACASVALAGCASGTTGTPGALDLPSVGPSTALAEQHVYGVTIALSADWKATQDADTGLTVSDAGGGATITVVVDEALKVDAGPDEPAYTASTYLETAVPFLVKEPLGIDVTESLKGRAKPLDVPGADNAAQLEFTGSRADEPVDLSAAAAQVSPNIAIVIGVDVEAGLWEQVLASLRVDPATLQPS